MQKKFVFVCLLIILFLRIFFLFSVETFVLDESYFHLRHIEHIQEHKNPMNYDELSFFGRYYAGNPLIYTVLAILLPTDNTHFWLLVLSQILWFCTSALIFLIIIQLCKNMWYGVLGIVVYSFFPIHALYTISSFSLYSFFTLLFLFVLYAFILWRKTKKRIWYWIFVCAFLSTLFFHQLGLLLLFSYILYIFFRKINSLDIEKREIEFSVFSLIVGLFLYYVLFTEALLTHSIYIFFTQFYTLSPVENITYLPQMGLLALAFGLYGLYQLLVNQTVQKGISFFFLSFFMTVLFFLSIGTISFFGGLYIICSVGSV
ncbi:MAG: hypothetical protein ACMXYA_03145, partial [Candidatus Woesearchaeota archaeon]